MGEISGENPHHIIAPKNKVPTKVKIALAAGAAITAAGAVLGIYKVEQGGGKGVRNLEPAVTRNADEARDILLKLVDDVFADRSIEKPEGAKYPDEIAPELFQQIPPVSHELFHDAEGFKKIIESCRTDGKPVTYEGKEYDIAQNFLLYRSVVLSGCNAGATVLMWGFKQTGDPKFRVALRNMYIIHKNALSAVKVGDPGLDDVVFDNSIKDIYRPVLGSDFVFQDAIKD